MRRSHAVHGRVIVHADLDCFYCQGELAKHDLRSVPAGFHQVEHVRLGIPTSVPLAVQQWDGLIAVNYEARKSGVKRGDRTAAAKQKCPQITLVHVETIGADDELDDAGTRNDKGACKVSLERYRTASFAIMAIFQAHCRRVERASIDEAYLDLTEEAAKLCQEAEAGNARDVADSPETDLQGTAGYRVDPTNAFDRALLAGARLTAAMRLAVEQELGFTVSAGIASNKVLAKLASSINKPNKQTVVPAGASSDMLDTVPLRSVRGLGGKLGETVVSWSKAETASDLKRFSQQDLVGNFGTKTGEWLWRACRGMDNEPVAPNLKPKSLSVCKSFTPVRDEESVLNWMRLLCTELSQRIAVDREAWSRRATKLTLQMISLTPGSRATQRDAGGGNGKGNTSTTRSRTVDIPGGGEPPTTASLVSEAMAVFAKTDNALPCSRLALTAHEFCGLVSGRGSIASFLRVLPPPSPPPQQPMPPPTSPFKKLGSKGVKPNAKEALAASPSGQAGGGSSLPEGDDEDVPGRETAEASTGLREVPRVGGKDGSRVDRSRNFEPSSHLAGDARDEKTAPSALRPGHERCPKCGKVLAQEDLPEHLDFHYAEGLQERYTREGDVARDMAARMSDRRGLPKRKVHEAGGGKGAKSQTKRPATGPRIDSFFRPT